MVANSSTDGVLSSRIIKEMPLSIYALAIPSRYKACIWVPRAEDDLASPPKPATAYQSWELHRARARALAQALLVGGGAFGVWEQLSRTFENMKSLGPALLSPKGVQRCPPLPGCRDG